MKISPRVVLQKKVVSYKLNLININTIKHIESIYIFSKNDYFHNEKIKYKIDKDEIFFEYKMNIWGEFFVKVNFETKESKTINLFCVDEKLIELQPLKGDLHMHTIFSDGKRTPFAMSLESLEKGMDFISITDHDNYDGSLEAIKRVKNNSVDLIILPGEEVSVGRGDTTQAKGNGHILSINAKAAIDEQRKDVNKYKKELNNIVKLLKEKNIPEELDLEHYAKNIWAVDKIHSLDGLAILCHPHWVYYDKKFHLHQAIYKEMLRDSNIDAVEVFGDIDGIEECNNLTYLTYLQYRTKDIAAIGNSDAHDNGIGIGDRFSILFTKKRDSDSIVEAIKSNRSVAVLKRDQKEYQLIGDEQLAQYTLFLLKEYFPKHDLLKYKESKLIVDALINQSDFRHKIDNIKSKLLRHKKSFFLKR